MTYLRTTVCFGPETEATLIFGPCVGCCQTIASCQGPGEYAV